MERLPVGKNDKDQRLDRFLKKVMEKAPKTLLYKSIRKKNITVNGKKATPDQLLKENDQVEIYFSPETFKGFQVSREERESKWPRILYEDDRLIAVAKPCGILTHGRGEYTEETMVDRLLTYLRDTGSYVPRREKSFVPAFAHRLDRNTSGILVAGKDAESLRLLNTWFQEREVEKHYLALVHGKMDRKMDVEDFLDKNEKKNRVKVSSQGQRAVSVFTPLLYSEKYTLVDVLLVTGRSHQIRVQLKHQGFPIVGDPKYGDRRKNNLGMNHQWLHNHLLILPIGEEKLKITCPPEEHFLQSGRRGLGRGFDEYHWN